MKERVARELVGWTVAAAISILALLAALQIAGLPDVIRWHREEKRTASVCQKMRKDRAKRASERCSRR